MLIYRNRFSVIILILFLSISVYGEGKTENINLRNEISKTISVEKNIQKLRSGWSSEKGDLENELDYLLSEQKRFTSNIEKQKLQISIAKKRLDENIRREKEVKRVKNELSSFLDTIIERLENSIQRDLPFLKTEREKRILSLKEMMVNTQSSMGERFRRVYEALNIEAEYGSTVEVVQKNIIIDGKRVLTDIIRLGRISLFCQTLDQSTSGFFDRGKNLWVVLPAETNHDIFLAISMARLERTVDFVKLPIGRIEAK